MRKTLFWTVLFICWLTLSVVNAQTQVPAGPVSGTWTADMSPILVAGDIEIAPGETLTIDPGVVVEFTDGAGLSVRGTLYAIGAEDARITLTSAADSPGYADWTGLTFHPDAGRSELAFVTLEYAMTGVFLDEAEVLITGGIIRNNASNGVEVRAEAVGCEGGRAEATLIGTTLAHNLGYGVYFHANGDLHSGCNEPKIASAEGLVEDCEIFGNQNGVGVFAYEGYNAYGTALPEIVGNRIDANDTHGIYLGGDNPVPARMQDNEIAGNGVSGVHCVGTIYVPSMVPTIIRNRIASNGVQGIFNQSPGTVIESNDIRENAEYGVRVTRLGSFRFNGISDNGAYDFYNAGTAHLHLPDNYWGAGDADVIADRIYDREDDPGRGWVYFEPFTPVFDDTPPEVVETYPELDADGVAPGAFIRVVFNEPLNPDTVHADSALLVNAETGEVVPREVVYTEATIWVIPTAPLDFSTTYWIIIDSSIEDRWFAANSLPASLDGAFTTQDDCGARCPGRIVEWQPVDNLASGLAFDGEQLIYAARFTESGEYSRIYRTDDAGVVFDEIDPPAEIVGGLAFGYDDRLYCEAPAEGRLYRLGIDGEDVDYVESPADDPVGLAGDGSNLWQADGDAQRIFRFSQWDPNEIFDLPHRPADLASDGQTVWILTDDRICQMDSEGNIIRSVDAPEGASGLAFDGSHLRVTYNDGQTKLGKMTIPLDDDQRPDIPGVIPPDDGDGVLLGAGITVVFDEATDMDRRTINPDSVSLSGAGAPPLSISYSDRRARFVPAFRLAPDTAYTLSMTGEVADLSGNPIVGWGGDSDSFETSFRTVEACAAPCPGDIIDEWEAPSADPTGLAVDGTTIWVLGRDTDMIQGMTLAGEFADAVPAPASNGSGLTSDGTYLHLVAAGSEPGDSPKLITLDRTGTVISEWPLPIHFGPPTGVAFDGTHLHVGRDGYSIYRFDPAGEVIDSLPTPAPVTALAAGDGLLWMASADTGAIYGLDGAGNVVESFPAPGPSPQGLAIDGDHLLVSDNATDRIYRVATRHVLPVVPGDIDGDRAVTLQDAVIALRISAGLDPGASVDLHAEVDGDGVIGIVEAAFALREVVAGPAIVGGAVSGDFGVTDATYPADSDWDATVAGIFGSGYRVADWTDLEAFRSGGGDLAALFDRLGLVEHDAGAFVTRDGDPSYDTTRFYFAVRHDHDEPDTFLAHDEIDNHLITLGSWDSARRILVVREGF